MHAIEDLDLFDLGTIWEDNTKPTFGSGEEELRRGKQSEAKERSNRKRPRYDD